MSRYYRRRYTRVVKPKKKWATNMYNIIPTAAGGGTNQVVFYQKLCENSTQTGNPTPVVLKTGNYKLQIDASFVPSASAAVSFSAYIIYIPESVWPSGTIAYSNISPIISNHPEWILAWRYGSNDFINTSGTGNVDSVKVSSRLKRNLNSGDAIYFIGIATTASGANLTRADCRGMCQFWTCAN